MRPLQVSKYFLNIVNNISTFLLEIHLSDMLSVHVQGCLEVDGAVSILEHGESAVFFTEFGVMVLISWILNLKLPLPLSPPNFTHSWSSGMAPSCEFNPLGDL